MGKEKDSYYTTIGGTMVRMSNHCTHMDTWEQYLNEYPQFSRYKILSLVFEDKENTYTEDCLFLTGKRDKMIEVDEYVFKLHGDGQYFSKPDILSLVKSLEQLYITNKFIENTNKGEYHHRVSVIPDYMNLETTADGRVIPGGINGMDYSIEESKTRKNMNKKVIKINESQLRNMISESVKKVLKESSNDTDSEIYQAVVSFLDEIHRIITTNRDALDYYGEEIRNAQQSAIKLRDTLINPTLRRMGVSQGDLTFGDMG